jgi:hypothetical protein
LKEEQLWPLRYGMAQVIVHKRKQRRWQAYKAARWKVAWLRSKTWRRRQAWLLRWRPDRWLRLQLRISQGEPLKLSRFSERLVDRQDRR